MRAPKVYPKQLGFWRGRSERVEGVYPNTGPMTSEYSNKAKNSSAKSIEGLTLIEVLVALVIIAISFTAVLKSEEDSIRTTAYLQDKTLATWVANNVVASIRLNMRDTSSENMFHDQTQMMGRTWYWTADVSTTQSDAINSIQVQVSPSQYGQPIVTVNALIPGSP